MAKIIEMKKQRLTAIPDNGMAVIFCSKGKLLLQAEFPTVWQEYIEHLSEYMASTGKRYQSHAATIRRWIADDRRKAAPPARDRDYTVREGETV